ncbi:MFS transporter [Undibacterium sp. TJN25]|uniref:MFS transporter n=1 Tax=Undibacterium sp. TJN25 TaxID=3413056 RepID=UPI003BF1A711
MKSSSTHATNSQEKWLYIRSVKVTLKPSILALALFTVVQFFVAMGYNLVSSTVVPIAAQFGFSQNRLQWMVSAYALAFGGLLLVGKLIGEVIGWRLTFFVGLSLFGFASVVGGFGESPAVLITSRVLQGAGGALLFPATVSLIGVFFTDESARRWALTLIGTVSAIGGASGAFASSFLTNHFGWSSAFFVNIPFSVAAAAAAFILLPRIESASAGALRRMSLTSALTATGAIALSVVASALGSERGWGDIQVLAMLAGAASLLVWCLMIETKASRPTLFLCQLREHTLATGMLVAVLFASSFGAHYYLLTAFLQDVLLYSPAVAGIVFLPLSLSFMLGTRLTTVMVVRVGQSWTLMGSLVAGAIGLLLVAWSLTGGSASVVRLLPGLFLDGMGHGFLWALMLAKLGMGVNADGHGAASDLTGTVQQIGNPLGRALLAGLAASGALSANTTTNVALVGLQHAFVAAALLVMVTGLVLMASIKLPLISSFQRKINSVCHQKG